MSWKWSACTGVILLALCVSSCSRTRGATPTTSTRPASASSTSLAPATTSTSPGSSSTTTTTATSGVAACTPSVLRLAAGRTTVAAGTTYLGVTIADSAQQPCTLHGYPGITLVGSTGTLTLKVSHHGDLPIFDVPPANVVLQLGRAPAGLVMSYAYSDNRGSSCNTSVGVVVSPPGGGTFPLSRRISLCRSSGLSISAIVSGAVYHSDYGNG